MKIERIKKIVEDSKSFPNSYIEYNGELPDVKGIEKDSFFGVKAVFNKNVPKSAGCSLMYKY